MVIHDKLKLPIYHYEMSDYFDSRFKKVKIWIAHTGENLNKTFFTKESLLSMAKTLPYTPIVGFVEKDDCKEDFTNHRQKIVLKEHDIEIEYEGHAYGFIPENPIYAIENREGKEWLTCEGYIWSKFNKALEIFENANGRKSQSMEIDSIQGFVDEDGLFNIEDCRVTGLCILGDKVLPAMTGSTIDFFSINDIKSEIQQMIFEFSEKGVNTELENEILENKDLEVVETETETEKEVEVEAEESEQAQEVTEVTEEVTEDVEESDEEVEVSEVSETSETFEKEVEDEAETESEEETEEVEVESEEVEESEEVTEEASDVYEITFALSHADIRAKIYSYLNKKHPDYWVSVVEVYDTEFVFSLSSSDECTHKFYKSEYSISQDDIQVEPEQEVFAMFVTKAEQEKIDSEREYVKQLQEELDKLKDFQVSLETKEKLDLLNSYSEDLSDEEYKVFESKLNELNKDDLEKEIVFSLFKKSKNETVNKVSAYSYSPVKDEADEKYGTYGRLFKK